jgi:exodeoxyribonuclease VII large subunit
VQVQGDASPDQIIRAFRYFNERDELPEVIVLIRGGGSAEDLAAFNDEQLVRTIASSRVPTLVGVGHEVDETLADFAADVRAATPSNAAQLLVPDRRDIIRAVRAQTLSILPILSRTIEQTSRNVGVALLGAMDHIEKRLERTMDSVAAHRQVLVQLNPGTVLARGYALLRGNVKVGASIEVETSHAILEAEVKHVRQK